MDWDTSIWLSCPIVFLWYPLKFHGPIPLNDIKPLFFPFFSIKWPKTTIFPNFFPNLCLQIWRNFDFEWPNWGDCHQAEVARRRPAPNDQLLVAGPVERWSGVVSPGNLETNTSENHGRKPWEIYGDFFKGNLNFGKSMFFFFRKPHFFSKSIFFRHGEVKKALLFLEGKHKRGSMIKSFIRFFSSGMWISGYQGLEPSITDGHTLVAFAYFFLLNGAKHRKILVPFWSSIWVPSGKQT